MYKLGTRVEFSGIFSKQKGDALIAFCPVYTANSITYIELQQLHYRLRSSRTSQNSWAIQIHYMLSTTYRGHFTIMEMLSIHK
ncbi:hypothetical protein FRX31_023350 [Thalictrum thalictroides]|uniref:Uncharacterized protein n=1 Tax=Thalictrum thalictroides TaxID=46969 RepID=A0A7J6VQB0_THATH|nr:hypothetical protein FRX31_023350 [Thalictrum thalictroides]